MSRFFIAVVTVSLLSFRGNVCAAQSLTSEFLYQLSQEYLKAGKEEEAVQYLHKILLIDPVNSKAQEQLARLQQERQACSDRAIEETLDRLASAHAQASDRSSKQLHEATSRATAQGPSPVRLEREQERLSDKAFRRLATSPWVLEQRGKEQPKARWLETDLSVSNGYRLDQFMWNIAGDINGKNPNILSELTWKDLEIYEIAGDLTLEMPYAYTRASIKKGWINNGQSQDSDFNKNNRGDEFSRSVSSTDDRGVFDVSWGAGIPLKFWDGKVKFVPLGGYSYHELKLKDTDGVQVIPNTGPFKNLNSTYESFWHGPWTGVDWSVVATPKLRLIGSFEVHWARYRTRADWNLRTDFKHPKSFADDAEARGLLGSAGIVYALTKHWSIRTMLDYAYWSAHPGHARTFFANGTADETRLNTVKWRSLALLFGLTASF